MFEHVAHLLMAEDFLSFLDIQSESVFKTRLLLRGTAHVMSRDVPFLKYDVLKMNQIRCMLNTAVLSSLSHLDGVSIEKMIMHFMTRRG